MTRGFALGAAVGLLGGVIGAATVQRCGTERDPQGVPRESPSTAPASDPAPRLEGNPSGTLDSKKQLEQAQVRIQQLTAELEAARRPAPAPPIATQPKQDELPASAREHATRLGVSEGALTALWRARNLYYGVDATTREQLIATLRPFGEEVLRAVAAVNRGGGGHISLPMVVADLGLAGGGELLIRMIEEDGTYQGSLLRALPGYDSPRVRTYLLERIARETEPGAFWYLAAALGELEEPRGAEAIRLHQILGPRWGGVRGYILYDIGRMGGPAAIRLLEDYLLLASADHVGSALGALAKLDRERARSHALRIKQSDRYAFLDVMDRVQVDSLSG